MNIPTISFKTKISADYQRSMNFDSYPDTTADKKQYLAWNPKTKDPVLQFASVLAHEVRNPLANINLSIEMLDTAITDNGLKIYLDIITRSSARINDLMNELLKNRHADEMNTGEHSVHQLLDEVLEMAKDRIILKNISVKRNYAATDCRITLDRPKMKIALTNIIINAVDAMTPGEGELKLFTKSIDSSFTIEIQDNGCGISKENLQCIFKPYFTNKPGGMGLGLAATSDILRANHVRVKVESKEGNGTRFSLFFKQKNRHTFYN